MEHGGCLVRVTDARIVLFKEARHHSRHRKMPRTCGAFELGANVSNNLILHGDGPKPGAPTSYDLGLQVTQSVSWRHDPEPCQFDRPFRRSR